MTGDVVGERYRLDELIGSGGTAAVFRATDVRLGRLVAVKVVHPHLVAQHGVVAAMLVEARAAASLDHPNVGRVLDAGVDTETTDGSTVAWIALELIDGATLTSLVAETGALPVADALDLVAGVLAGLAHAHGRGIVHRDLSPSNVMVLRRPGGGYDVGAPVVLDLGTSASTNGTTLVPGGGTLLIRATPHYASPELALGRPVDARGDVYAAGALLNLLLTGVPPFDGSDPRTVLEAQVRRRPDPPSVRRPGLSPDLDRLVLRALEKNPSARFESASDMRIAILRCRAALDLDLAMSTTVELPPIGAASPAVDPAAWLPRPLPARTSSPTAHVERTRPRPLGAGAQRWSGRLAAAAVVAVGTLLVAQQLGGAGEAVATDPVFQTLATTPDSGADRPSPRSTQPAAHAVGILPGPAPAPVGVPTVAGQQLDVAGAALLGAGLAVGAVSHADGPGPAGSVLRSSPGAGEQVAVGSTVDLVIATGYVAVPDVVGLGRVRARAGLEDAGFVVIERGIQLGAAAGAGFVAGAAAGTEPAAGTRASFGGGVVLLIARAGPGAPGGPTSQPTPTEPAPTEPAPVPGVMPTTPPAPQAAGSAIALVRPNGPTG
jgi:serine/threonine protein kinase